MSRGIEQYRNMMNQDGNRMDKEASAKLLRQASMSTLQMSAQRDHDLAVSGLPQESYLFGGEMSNMNLAPSSNEQQQGTFGREWEERIRLFIDCQRLCRGEEHAKMYQKMAPHMIVTQPDFLEFLIHSQNGLKSPQKSDSFNLSIPSVIASPYNSGNASLTHDSELDSPLYSHSEPSYSAVQPYLQMLSEPRPKLQNSTSSGNLQGNVPPASNLWHAHSQNAPQMYSNTMQRSSASLSSSSSTLPKTSPRIMYTHLPLLPTNTNPYGLSGRPPSTRRAATQWTHEEERLLAEKIFEEMKPAWTSLAKHLPGHDANNIRKHWGTMRKRLLRRPDPAFFEALDLRDGIESSPTRSNLSLLTTSANSASSTSSHESTLGIANDQGTTTQNLTDPSSSSSFRTTPQWPMSS